jgi:hypothetical protein
MIVDIDSGAGGDSKLNPLPNLRLALELQVDSPDI